MLVLEEGLHFTLNLLWYFAELEPLLDVVHTLPAISWLNDNELLPSRRTPRRCRLAYRCYMARDTLDAPRVASVGLGTVLQVRSSAQTVPHARAVCAAPRLQGRLLQTGDHSDATISLCSGRLVDLRNVSRSGRDEYHRLFLQVWPGESLSNAIVTAAGKRHSLSRAKILPQTVGRFFGFPRDPPSHQGATFALTPEHLEYGVGTAPR